MRRLAVAVLAAGLALVPAAPAAACPSRSARNLHDRLVHADAAFVGRLAQRDGGVLVYRVQVRVKGHLTRRMRVHGLRGCGVPRRTGLLLDRRHGVWMATAAVKPGALLNAAGIGP